MLGLTPLKGHKFLFEQNILHRDISPGNIMLHVDPNATVTGFLMDLDLASPASDDAVTIKRDTESSHMPSDAPPNKLEASSPLVIKSVHSHYENPKRGALMSVSPVSLVPRTRLLIVASLGYRLVHRSRITGRRVLQREG